MIWFENRFCTDDAANEIFMRHIQKRLLIQMDRVYLAYDKRHTGNCYLNNVQLMKEIAAYFPKWVLPKHALLLFQNLYEYLKSEEKIKLDCMKKGLLYEYALARLIEKEIVLYEEKGCMQMREEDRNICIHAFQEDIEREQETEGETVHETGTERFLRYETMEDFICDFFWDEDYLLLEQISMKKIGQISEEYSLGIV